MKAKPTDLDLQILKRSSLKNFFFDKHIRQTKKNEVFQKKYLGNVINAYVTNLSYITVKCKKRV